MRSRTRENGFKLEESRLKLDMRKKFFSVRPRTGLSNEIGNAPSLKVFKARLDGASSNQV